MDLIIGVASSTHLDLSRDMDPVFADDAVDCVSEHVQLPTTESPEPSVNL